MVRGLRSAPTRFDFMPRSTEVLVQGSGDVALVLVHGWAGDGRVWQLQVSDFSAAVRTLVVDLPGHGGSDESADGFALDAAADALAAVMDHAGVSSAILVGHSNGATIVRQFWRRYPERTRALVIVDGALRPMIVDEAQRQAILDRFAGERGDTLASAMLDGILAADLDPVLRADLLDMVAAVPLHVQIATLRESWDSRYWRDDLIEVPVLSVMAESPFWSDAYRNYLRDLVPDLDYQVMTGVSHYLHCDVPVDFNRRVLAFLAERDLLR